MEYWDLWVRTASEVIAIELKYPAKAFRAEVNGEALRLRNQSAHDIRRYDVIKDIVRIEALLATLGHARLRDRTH